jgi:hypothetical protein
MSLGFYKLPLALAKLPLALASGTEAYKKEMALAK